MDTRPLAMHYNGTSPEHSGRFACYIWSTLWLDRKIWPSLAVYCFPITLCLDLLLNRGTRPYEFLDKRQHSVGCRVISGACLRMGLRCRSIAPVGCATARRIYHSTPNLVNWLSYRRTRLIVVPTTGMSLTTSSWQRRSTLFSEPGPPGELVHDSRVGGGSLKHPQLEKGDYG